MSYTLKKFAEKFQVSEHTIRYYTNIGLLPCQRDSRNRRVFDEESVNWMQGINCLKRCGASIDAIKEYGRLCLLPENKENLQARYQIIRRQHEHACQKAEEAKAAVAYMDEKLRHYENILSGIIPDDSNPNTWTDASRPLQHAPLK